MSPDKLKQITYGRALGLCEYCKSPANIFNPRKQFWSDHFAWSDDGIEIIALSSTGRVTLQALRLKRQELQNLRTLLAEAGKHPPKAE